MKEYFDPFQNFAVIKSQYDAKDLRNFAFRGLEDFTFDDFASFVKKHQDNESFQDLIELNCGISISQLLTNIDRLQLDDMMPFLKDNMMASCNQFYSAKCEELAELIESVESIDIDELEKKSFGDFLKEELQYKCDNLSEENLIEFMGKTWTYDGNNLFEAVLKQVKGEHISENNDLTAKANLADALNELYFAYRDGRDIGTNGFRGIAEAAHFVDENKEAILNWFDEYANESSDGANIGSVLQELSHNFNAVEDLLFNDGMMTKAVLARQLMYMVANDVCETHLEDYFDARVLDASILIENLLDKSLESNVRKRK